MRSMRLAGHTYAYRERPLAGALDELQSLGLTMVEVWLGHATEDAAGAARALRERGLETAAVSAGGFYTPDSDAVPGAIELAEALGTPVIVACVAPRVLDAVVGRVPAGITLCVENHWDQRLARARDVQRALDGYPGVAACVDTGHAIMAGQAPERFVRALGARVGHVHLKDAALPPLRERLLGRRLRRRLLAKPEPITPGTGALEVARLRDALSGIGFAGTVTVEHEGTQPTAALRRLVDEWSSLEDALASGG
jgi:sugar phosphate isomerase/epimerase